MPLKIHFVSLGCDKNLVDSEIMLGLLSENGYEITDDPAQAHVIIVNTCGFIAEATRESIQAIMEMGAYKKNLCRALIAAGCMAQRYKEDILKELPEVDAIVGVDDFYRIADIIQHLQPCAAGEKIAPSGVRPPEPKDAPPKRMLSTLSGFAYLKIAEGCDNHCTYCTIPALRGPYRSRSIDSLVAEAKTLVAAGVREMILVAQDTALYGTDLYGAPKLAELLRRLAEIEDLVWMRLLYAYPENITDDLIAEMAVNPKVCPYIDIPLQHASDDVLKRMGRRTDSEKMRLLLQKLRAAMPDIAVRTTFIVGFPGETDRDFQTLLDFIGETRFDKLGVFAYSREEGTPAYSMPNQISERKKIMRRKKLLESQKKISLAIQKNFLQKEILVMVEGRVPDKDNPGEFVYCGRSSRDCHEIDGLVFFRSEEERLSGEFLTVRITEAYDYDLFGEIAEESDE